ncbi:MMPL family transporter [Streptomyces apocyni]|uniref:MMPL family transporter n=1 Tax=Streptomyces apocyni TaxID=2654677 RepID=UPI0012E9A95E|nr:MMPL family transporter [Streptomyces apocyni]
MYERIGRFVVRRRIAVLLTTVLLALLAGAVGSGGVDRLKGGGLTDPASESSRAGRELVDRFDGGSQNLILLARSAEGDVDGSTSAAAGRELTERLSREAGVSNVTSYWTSGSPAMRAKDGASALVLARVDGDETTGLRRLGTLDPAYASDSGPLTVRLAGSLQIQRELEETIASDLTKAESVAMPITLILMVLVFGAVTAALLPLGMGLIAILGTLGVLAGITALTDVSVFALNLTTALGLGLAIDYALLMVSRYREELQGTDDPHEAVVRAVCTAGRTIVFSAATVAVSLSALLVFPQFFFRSFAYSGIAVVLLSAFAGVVVLPALLAVLKGRVNKFAVPTRRRTATPRGDGFWYRTAHRVMRRPVLVGTGVAALLIVLGLPFQRVEFGLFDHRVLPENASARQVSETIGKEFSGDGAGALHVVATDTAGAGQRATGEYATRLSRLGGVARVEAPTGAYADGQRIAEPGPDADRRTRGDATHLSVVPDVQPMSPQGEALVRDVRETQAPYPVLVGGPSAELVDAKQSIGSHLPWALLVVGVSTFVLLFLAFGSLLLPLKAMVLNLLSLTALFGSMVWIFQDGHLADLLGFTATGTLNLAIPVLMFCMAFGLSMDYEVFLISRIREEYLRTGDNTESVARGLEHTGRIITAAALVMSVVFLSFAASGVAVIKLFGLGVAIAVLVDAAVIRPLLVPAFMRLTGRANWWAPAPLRRFHDRFGISEGTALHPAPSKPVREATGAGADAGVRAGVGAQREDAL